MAFFAGFGPAFNQGLRTGAEIGRTRSAMEESRAAREQQQVKALRDENFKQFQNLRTHFQTLASTDPAKAVAALKNPTIARMLNTMSPFMGVAPDQLRSQLALSVQLAVSPQAAGTAAGQKEAASRAFTDPLDIAKAGGTARVEALASNAPDVAAAAAAKAATVAGAETRARLSATTKPQNYYNPGTRQTHLINENDPSQVARMQQEGFLRMPTMVQAAKPGEAFDLSGKEMGEFRGTQVSALQALGDIDRMNQQLDSAKTFTGLVGTGAQFFGNLSGSLQQLSAFTGRNDLALLDPRKYDLADFGAAAQTQSFRSNVINLAYALARASDPSGKLSDADVQRQVDRLAASSGDKDQIRAALAETRRGLIANIQAQARVLSRSNPEIMQVIDPAFLPPPEASQATPPSTGTGTVAVPQYKEGQTATNPETGIRMIFRNGAWTQLGQ